jgi:hypothetical protein
MSRYCLSFFFLTLHYTLSVMKVSQEELQEAEKAIGEFSGDNRAGI